MIDGLEILGGVEGGFLQMIQQALDTCQIGGAIFPNGHTLIVEVIAYLDGQC